MDGHTRLALVVILLLLPAAALALPHPVPFEYFPMHEGDLWVYVMANDDASELPDGFDATSFEVRALDGFEFDRCRGYCFHNYAYPLADSAREFYNDGLGRTCEHLNGRALGVWYPWTEPHRGIVLPDTKLLDCLAGTMGELEHGCTGLVTGTVTVPAGTFGDVATVLYDVSRAPCQDAALVSESFAPGIGLIAREIATLAGAQRWVLSRAIINGQQIGGAGGRSAPSDPPSHAPVDPASWGAIKATFSP